MGYNGVVEVDRHPRATFLRAATVWYTLPIAAAAIVLGCTGMPKGARTERPEDALGASRLAEGDEIEVALTNIGEAILIALRVGHDGRISLPHIGRVRIAGLTAKEAAARIEKRYGELADDMGFGGVAVSLKQLPIGTLSGGGFPRRQPPGGHRNRGGGKWFEWL